MNLEVGRGTPCAPLASLPNSGAHGVTRPTIPDPGLPWANLELSKLPVNHRAERGQPGPQLSGVGFARTRLSVFLGVPRRVRAFSLIEVIAVLAIIAILMAMLLPAFIKRLDRLAADKETATLKAFAQGLQQNVWTNKRIPAATGNDWAQAIAASAAYQTSDVLNNPRRLPRAFLIDPNLQIGTVDANTLPFQQTSNGVASVNNPRFMILSSLSGALPVTSGITNTFDTIWNTPDGSVPSGWTSWNNRGDDLKIQRINLAPSFKRLILNNDWTNAMYSIDGSTRRMVPTNSLDAYFVENSLLSLYSSGTNVDAMQVLVRDSSFTYAASNWTGTIIGWPATGGGGGGGDDLGVIIKLFMSSATNTFPNPDTSPRDGFTAITNYMAKYTAWANAGFPNNSLWTAVKDAGKDSSKPTSVYSVINRMQYHP